MAAQFPNATWAPSPNFNRGREEPVDLIVIHITDGQPDARKCIARFQRPETQASAHFVIGRAGEVYQLVRLEDRAWHCKGWNDRSVGIEHVARTPGELGAADEGLALTEEQLEASAKLVAWLLARFALPLSAVVPHCASPTTTHHDCGKDVERGGIWPWTAYRERLTSLG